MSRHEEARSKRKEEEHRLQDKWRKVVRNLPEGELGLEGGVAVVGGIREEQLRARALCRGHVTVHHPFHGLLLDLPCSLFLAWLRSSRGGHTLQ